MDRKRVENLTKGSPPNSELTKTNRKGREGMNQRYKTITYQAIEILYVN